MLLFAHHSWATIVVSKEPFSGPELARADRLARERGYAILAAPDRSAGDPTIAALLDPAQRADAIAASAFDLSAPSDQRPYFFLQLRPRDFGRYLASRADHPIFEITFRSVRVLLLLSGLSLAFALAVWVAALALHRGAPARGADRSYRWLTLYFSAIGFGYLAIQLALHQRLILVLGHPTHALAAVLVAMLLGSGAGAEWSRRVAPAHFARVWLAIPAALALLALAFAQLGRIDAIASALGRAAACGALVAGVGTALGFALPLGVRLAAATGAGAVQRLWALNGAASIAATAFAALLGLSFGSGAVLAAGGLCYVTAGFAGWRAQRSAAEGGAGVAAAR